MKRDPGSHANARAVKIRLEGVPQIPDAYLQIMDRKRHNRLTKRQREACDKIITAATVEISRRVREAMKKTGAKDRD